MIDVSHAPAAGPRPHRAWLAALLSFVFPGLGQAYAGQTRAALLLAIPVILLVIAVLLLLTGALGGIRNSLLSNDFLVGVLVANGALLAWRGVAIAHAGLTPWPGIRGHERRTALIVVAGMLVATVAMHGWIGGVVVQLNETLSQVFAPEQPGGAAAPPAGDEDDDEPDAEDSLNEPDYHWDGTERINVLLLGTDAAPGREAVLTDVVLVVSVDPVEQTAVMISVPRDTGFVPLPDESLFLGGLFPERVNALGALAAQMPRTWCPDLDDDDAAACGLRTMERSIGLYLGIEIHHYALVDMAGFAEMIDAVGGLDLCLPGRLVDPEFDGSLENNQADEPLILPAGCHPYDGLDALAYARSRKGWIEMADGTRVVQTDFKRNERQQRVLLALRRELAESDTFVELPGILQAIGRTVSTDFPRSRAGDLASLLPLIAGPDIERIVLGYPGFVDLPAQPDVNYLLIPQREAIREEMARIFGADALIGWYLGSDAIAPGDEATTGSGAATP